MEALHDSLATFPNKLDVWLEFGTLLGAYREHSFIKNDTDIDLGVERTTHIPGFINHLTRRDFFLLHNSFLTSSHENLDGKLVQITLSYKGFLNIDLFVIDNSLSIKSRYFQFDAESGLSPRQTLSKYGNRLRAHSICLQKFSLRQIDFCGLQWNIPFDTQNHLTELYGDDFMVPKAYSYHDRPKDRELVFDPNTLGKNSKRNLKSSNTV